MYGTGSVEMKATKAGIVEKKVSAAKSGSENYGT